MLRREKSMKKQESTSAKLKFRNPISVLIEKLEDKSARVYGDLSKEALRGLLMSSMTLVPKTRPITSKFKEILADSVTDYRKDEMPIQGTWDSRGAFYGESSFTKKKVAEEEEEDEDESLLTCPSSLTDETKLSYDGKWLRKYVKKPLRMALKEIVTKKPYDPVEYLGFWLLDYKRCQEDQRRQQERDQELFDLRCCIQCMQFEKEEEKKVTISSDAEEEEDQRDLNFTRYNSLEI